MKRVTTSNTAQGLYRGDAAIARAWVSASTLPEDQKGDLLAFINRFPSLTFVRDDSAVLDRHAAEDRVVLPAWFRAVRSTLAFVEPPVQFRLDDFEGCDSPRSDDVEDLWYELGLGYHGAEQRDLFFGDAKIYRIGAEQGDCVGTYLGIDLEAPDDLHIFDFYGGDLADNKFDGRPVRGSLYPVFRSYAALLAHIVEVRAVPWQTKPA
jgi:hypothetical protein